MIAENLIRNDITPLQQNTAVAAALAQLEDFKVSHLPVASGTDFLGLVAEEALLEWPEELLNFDDYRLQPAKISVLPTSHYIDAIVRIGEFKLSMLPIVGEKGNYLGYINPLDIVIDMGQMNGLKNPGAILTLEMHQNDYHMGQIAQIIEGNDAQILASFVTYNEVSKMLEVTLRINRIDLSAVISSLERYNYTISATYHISQTDLDMQARYENFMKYLNI